MRSMAPLAPVAYLAGNGMFDKSTNPISVFVY